MTYCLDSSFIINLLRKGGVWAETLQGLFTENNQLLISVATYAELDFGSLKSSNMKKEREKINGFLSDFNIQLFPITKETAEMFSQLKMNLENKGLRVEDFDLLIGACAIENNAVLVTDNVKHFSRFPDLRIYKNGI